MRNDARRKKVIDMVTPLISKIMAQNGKIIEGGWIAARAGMYKDVTDPETLKLMRECYMGGAQHLFSTVIQALSAGDEVSLSDERMMESIVTELDNWYEEMAEKYLGPTNN
jgi:hypothetical protein